MSEHEGNFENHAYLIIDELENIKDLFDLDVSSIVVDLKGRTTIQKQKILKEELGSKVIEHAYIKTDLKNCEYTSKEDIEKQIQRFRAIGAENIYATKLVVCWGDGTKDTWSRHILYTTDPLRESHSTRLNALTLKVGKFKDVELYKNKYNGLVKRTICEIDDQHKIVKKRTCKGIWV